jgi:uncharacterized protein (TIGR00297 family)
MHNLADFSAICLFHPAHKVSVFAALTVIFALLGRAVRGVTAAGSVAGAIVCFALLWGAGLGGFAALLVVFLLTWIATRIGYARKQSLGMAEARIGRDAFQVLANVGIASICALAYAGVWPNRRLLIAMGAALCEAAADTVSSELGQSVGGIPRLVTDWKQVAIGSDGAVTLVGTLAGIAAAIIVGLACALFGIFAWRYLLVCVAAGVIGMLADSFLGATLERGHIIGNNAVNFASTTAAALLAFLFS